MIFMDPRHFCLSEPLPPLRKYNKIGFYNCFDKKEYNPGWIHYYIFIFLLILKEIKMKTFPWTPKSIMDPRH